MRGRLLPTLVVTLLVGCSGAPPPLSPTSFPVASHATSAPTPEPTPEPTPTDVEELVAACFGKPVPWAAPYAGKVHPLVVAGPWGGDAWDWFPDLIDINQKWRDGEWTSPMIQLVVCPGKDEEVPGRSCGIYERSDGVTGELTRLKVKQPIRVIIAETGKRLQTKALYGEDDDCPSSEGVPLGADPPWFFLGDSVTPEQINEYATAVSKQTVK
jgi:hypothetical protein